MPDFLEKLVIDANARIRAGYYDVPQGLVHKPQSLKSAITSAHKNAIIAEIKLSSPSLGRIRTNLDPADAAIKMVNGGAIALSVLTEPDNFEGSLTNLLKVRRQVSVPVLMKDIIIDSRQIDAGIRVGADAMLLIHSVFQNDSSTVSELIRYSHDRGTEVLLEVHDEEELASALESEADIVGVNNRNLKTLHTDLTTTLRLIPPTHNRSGKCLVSESGFTKAEDIRQLKSGSRADGFLIGSSIMRSENLESKVREFVLA